MKSLVLFNNKGGVGKTTLTFNIAHMMARLGTSVVVLDYDPQCNITSIFLDEDEMVELWEEGPGKSDRTVADCVEQVRRGKGDVLAPRLREVADRLWLLPGHLSLSRFEQPLAEEWPKIFAATNERAMDVTSSLARLSHLAAESVKAGVVLFDVGPSLGALNRAALLGADSVIIPVAPDLFSLQGLRNVGPTLREWRTDWERACGTAKMEIRDQIPRHRFQPVGYIVQQHLARADRPVSAYRDWAARIPEEFRKSVLEQPEHSPDGMTGDPNCIAAIKHFASLVPLAQTARKPMFDLKQADGVGGGQIQAVARCRREFESLVQSILSRV